IHLGRQQSCPSTRHNLNPHIVSKCIFADIPQRLQYIKNTNISLLPQYSTHLYADTMDFC
ncbi:MAG: hypothetical protein KAS22_04760, partial [Candidatus Heimdallarchaeota archaeon]|nr:hypothetical protein [Candidatus Heimdallarchaeota archaeon]